MIITGDDPLALSVPFDRPEELVSLDVDTASGCDVDLLIAAGVVGKSDCSNREEETEVGDKCLKSKVAHCEPLCHSVFLRGTSCPLVLPSLHLRLLAVLSQGC